MKIIRAPLRISLGGGGTDLPSWYRDNGGFFISAAINKYIYFTGTERIFDKKIWLSYSQTEICNEIHEIKHELYSKVIEKYSHKLSINTKGIEIHSISEVPGQSGLGSSGSFLVGLIQLLNSMTRREMARHDIAELACKIEIDELKKSSGKQDQFISAYGGVCAFEVDKTGNISVEDLNLPPITLTRLQNNLLIYHTGYARDADSILKKQESIIRKNCSGYEAMVKIYEIGRLSYNAIKLGNLELFGRLMHEHWEVKKSIADVMSNPVIDSIYEDAISVGALGGKVMGAGGGGFFLFYVPENAQLYFRSRMESKKLKELNWKFDFDGCILHTSI
jgi:D-glycero-alpha-D-manno-heptose-7-phosphate kinase